MRSIILMGMVCLLAVSCDKEGDDNNSGNAYYPLSIGNYWVYNHYDVSESGELTETDIIDTVTVTRDTLVGGVVYYVLEGGYYPIVPENESIVAIVRDSSGYIVDINNEILFSEDNFTDTLRSVSYSNYGEPFLEARYKMEMEDSPVSTPAGTFDVLNYQGTIETFSDGELDQRRFTNTYYAREVGKVFDSFFYVGSNEQFEKRLVDYHIN